jgi:uncharacterized membrane protein
MRAALVSLTESTALLIDGLALIVIVGGTIGAVVGVVQILRRPASDHERRLVWLRYARWLVAGLTFQLAADIIETSVSADWLAIGRLAAIGAIRTFLDVYLERSVTDVRERQRADGA